MENQKIFIVYLSDFSTHNGYMDFTHSFYFKKIGLEIRYINKEQIISKINYPHIEITEKNNRSVYIQRHNEDIKTNIKIIYLSLFDNIKDEVYFINEKISKQSLIKLNNIYYIDSQKKMIFHLNHIFNFKPIEQNSYFDYKNEHYTIKNYEDLYLSMQEVKRFSNIMNISEAIFYKNSENYQIINQLYKDYNVDNFLNLKELLNQKKLIKQQIKKADEILNTCNYIKIEKEYDNKYNEMQIIEEQIDEIINSTNASDEQKNNIIKLIIEKKKNKKERKLLKKQLIEFKSYYDKNSEIKKNKFNELKNIKLQIQAYLE